MANQGKHQVTSRSGVPAPASIRMGSLAAGAMGLLGFSLATFCGLSAGNPFSEIIYRALVTSICLAVVGGLVGMVAGRVICEQLARQTELARQREAARELARQAEQPSAEAAPGNESPPSGQDDPGKPEKKV